MPLAAPPDDSAALASFPSRALDLGSPLYRIFRAVDSEDRPRSPFWFGARPTTGGNRYDLPAPDGCCYLAESPIGAWLEVFNDGDAQSIELMDLVPRRLATVVAPASVALADMTAAAARGFGLTGEIHVTTDYTVPRLWAERLHEAGWRGLRGRARHDPGLEQPTVTLFDARGEHPPFGMTWHTVVTTVEDDLALHHGVRQYGYELVPIPFDVATSEPRGGG